ncbi:hypothetical protein BJ138DRAFT_1106697 [Hygrophoropsis aurantiaca]|uniref:Uncharacterized protein n=1 Tax=Hygrophoropsis aurantiaca TaxID=72124 RepID=A0ACB7ZUQ7_9AGAM|nr:hypothetical protein BJ138DRAFT_1106697 [Hygrophoropsis aurantiaca]
MPCSRSAQIPTSPSKNAKKSVFLTALNFASRAQKPTQTVVCTVIPNMETPNNPRFPAVEAVLGVAHPIHSCNVRVRHRDHYHPFVVFFTYSPSAQHLNGSFPAALPWRGEVLVMKVGVRSYVTGLRGSLDRILAEEAALKFVAEACARTLIARGRRVDLPTNI